MENEQKQTITDLATLLHENRLSEIEYEANGVYIRLATSNTSVNTIAQPVSTPIVNDTPVQPKIIPSESKKNQTITSPMVGVVYLTKDPNTPPFVKVGDKVSVGQTVCLIEAMKTFNPIKSTKAGIITEILVESGSPVEYEQPLFSVE